MARPKRKLNIKCTQTDCGSGLHCFLPTKKMREQKKQGVCIDCGVDLIDWHRLHRRAIEDISYTEGALNREWVRNFFWKIPLLQRVLNHAKRKGKVALRDSIYRNLEATIGSAQPFRDGSQTEMPEPEDAANIYAYARHATATCCRKCISQWHGLPRGRVLTADELTYLSNLVCHYVDERIPDLPNQPQKIPAIRTQ